MSRQYQPPYSITSAVVNLISEISEAAGRMTVLADQSRALRLRRINRIRTIHVYSDGYHLTPPPWRGNF